MKRLIMSAVILHAAAAPAAENSVAVTVYNDNLALVREVRTLDLERGRRMIRFADVAAQIDPTSVRFLSLTDAAAIQILEQNFEYDLVGTERLLEKYIDQSIRATVKDGLTFTGTLLSAKSGDVILKTGDNEVKVIKSSSLQTIEFPALPEGLITRPTLVWSLECSKAGRHDSEISYLTRGIRWHAEYVALVNENDSACELNGWVSVENHSGATYEEAQLKLVAGDVHLVTEAPQRRDIAKVAYAAEAARPFEEKEFFEYHLYTLQRPATIKDRQIKQLSLFPPAQVKVKKIFTYDGQRDGAKVRVNLEMVNDRNSGLGMPLPKGKIRVYKKDAAGSQEFIGEDRIDHTPVDETFRIYLGNAFDIVGERVVKSVNEVGRRARQETVEIQLRNHKDEPVRIRVIEHFWGDWEFVGKTPPVLKKDALKAEFDIRVPADGENTFEYTVLNRR